MAEYDQAGVRALKDAVERTDASLFGFIFDGFYRELEVGRPGSGKSYGERLGKALALTLEDPIIKRCGTGAIVNAAKDEGWSEKYLSPHAKDALGRFIEKQANPQKGTAK